MFVFHLFYPSLSGDLRAITIFRRYVCKIFISSFNIIKKLTIEYSSYPSAHIPSSFDHTFLRGNRLFLSKMWYFVALLSRKSVKDRLRMILEKRRVKKRPTTEAFGNYEKYFTIGKLFDDII